GLSNTETGWGRAGETWSFLSELERLGLETWFRLGDKDLAVHLYRTNALRAGRSLSAITAELAERFGVAAEIIPMSEDRVRTVLDTDAGTLAFQDYFVRRRCEPAVSRILFEGAERAQPSARFADLLQKRELGGIVICPSNPFLSIGPILSLTGVADALARAAAPVVAITPIVGGDAIKGPTAKIMRELGLAVSPAAVAEHYRSFIDGFIVDAADESLAPSIAASGVAVKVANTVMRTQADRIALARTTVDFVAALRADRSRTAGP
ncbi:MAG TPA: 2-phospho-L-lactate transferase CofD family protein, partial [Woeseiaceae bacterium]|nr:2-phospho-L-lactate transferase CofD family protein [Woeseiaceae bacterium]